MPIVNTAELTGEALNWAVGKAEGLALQIQPAQYGIGARVFVETPSGQTRYRPVIEWMQCGPLLEKYDLTVGSCSEHVDAGERIRAMGHNSEGWPAYGYAADARTAICRAAVSAVSGPTVDVPEALL